MWENCELPIGSLGGVTLSRQCAHATMLQRGLVWVTFTNTTIPIYTNKHVFVVWSDPALANM